MRLDNARYELFCQNLAKGVSPELAYAAAGYKPQRQNAHRLMTRDDIRRRVAELQDDAVETDRPKRARVMRELARLAVSDISEVVRWEGAQSEETEEAAGAVPRSGNRLSVVDSDQLDPGTRAAISEISQARDGSIRVKMHPKIPALVELLKRLDLLEEAQVGVESLAAPDKTNVVDFKLANQRYGVPDPVKG